MESNDETELTPSVPGFAVRRRLGVGGGSTVWLLRVQQRTGRFRDLPEEVALKLPRGGSIGKPQQGSGQEEEGQQEAQGSNGRLADIRAELHAMEPLRHEHIVRVYGAVETSQGTGLLLEPYAAGSLSAVVRAEGGLSPGQLVTAATPVAQALEHLHAQGAAHGDVSPGNILLAPDGRPALADLGEAQLLGMSQSARGTEGFLAPEREDLVHDDRRLRSRARQLASRLAPEADVYSLAAVCWFVLTGEPPLPERERPPLTTLCAQAPLRLVTLLEDGLSTLPEDRPTAAEFAHDLYRAVAAEPLDLGAHVNDEVLPELPTRLPHRAPERRWQRPRRSAVLAASAAVLLVALGVTAWSWWGSSEEAQDSERQEGELSTEQAGLPEEEGLPGTEKSKTEPPDHELQAAEEQALALLDTEDPIDALEGIARLRTAALEHAEPVAVERYTVPDSPAHEAELDLLKKLGESGTSYSGPPLEIEPITGEAEPLQDAAAQVSVEVTVTAQDFVSTHMHQQEVTLVLHRAEGRWMLYEVHELST